jgi:23S rRNA pseudouridine2605 synthase
MHPKHEVDKVYRVWVTNFEPEKLEALKEPIELDGYKIKAPKVRPVRMEPTRAILDVTIHEGRNRQVRRMCQAAGLEVARLKRIAEGGLRIGELKPGAWRYLEPRELELLLQE